MELTDIFAIVDRRHRMYFPQKNGKPLRDSEGHRVMHAKSLKQAVLLCDRHAYWLRLKNGRTPPFVWGKR